MRHIPWVERFRPRSLSETILTRNQRNQIIGWWRKWVALWNLRFLWHQKYGKLWLAFYSDNKNKSTWRTHKHSWYEHFIKEFEQWTRTTEFNNLFEPDSIADVKPTTRPIFIRFIERTWVRYQSKKNLKNQDIPPFPYPAYKPLLLVGPPGTGKTTTAYALANDEGVFVIEFNASDERSRTSIRSVVREAAHSAGFFFQGQFPQKPPRLLLLDEVDGLSAQKDKGGFPALLELISEVKIPVIMTANVIHDPKVRQLMARSVTVFFDRPQEYQVKQLIRRISKIMKFEVPQEIQELLAKYAPDFRSIVVALETYYYTKRLPSLWHERMVSLQDAIRFAFGIKSKEGLDATISMAKRYLQESGEDIYDLLLTAWDNAWNFIDTREIFGFYKALADADYYFKIGSLKGNWRVAYLNSSNLLAYAMARYGKPDNIWNLRKKRVNIPKLGTLFLGLYQKLRGETPLGKLINKLARYTHISRRRALRALRLLAIIAKNRPDLIGQLLAIIGCEDDEVDEFIKYANIIGKNKTHLKNAYKSTKAKLGVHELKQEDLKGALIEKTKTEESASISPSKKETKRESIKTKKRKKEKGKEKSKAKMSSLDMFLK